MRWKQSEVGRWLARFWPTWCRARTIWAYGPRPHLAYLRHVLVHKTYVLLECWKRGGWGMLWLGLTHDWSKFHPLEWKGYVGKFHIDASLFADEFDLGWHHHYHLNKHHWQFWIGTDGNARRIPRKYLVELICDWAAMGRELQGYDSSKEWYLRHPEYTFHPETRKELEGLLKITPFDRQLVADGFDSP